MNAGQPGAELPGPDEREAVATELTRQASRLRSEIAACEQEEPRLRADCDLDAADAGAKNAALAQLHARTQRTRTRLARTERALARLRDGSFGVCARCSRPIGRERTVAMPTAELCVACQSLHEPDEPDEPDGPDGPDGRTR